MERARFFREKIRSGKPVVGPGITLGDPVVSEALSRVADFLWIDAEHNPLTPEEVQGHIMATRGSQCAPSCVCLWAT